MFLMPSSMVYCLGSENQKNLRPMLHVGLDHCFLCQAWFHTCNLIRLNDATCRALFARLNWFERASQGSRSALILRLHPESFFVEHPFHHGIHSHWHSFVLGSSLASRNFCFEIEYCNLDEFGNGVCFTSILSHPKDLRHLCIQPSLPLPGRSGSWLSTSITCRPCWGKELGVSSCYAGKYDESFVAPAHCAHCAWASGVSPGFRFVISSTVESSPSNCSGVV